MSTLVPGPNAAPLPTATPLVRGPDLNALRELLKNPDAPKDLYAYLITGPWADYLDQFTTAISATAQRVASATLTAQGAAIGATALPTSGNSGVYTVKTFVVVDVVDGVSSSVQLTITFTRNGVTQTWVGAALTTDTTTTKQTNIYTFDVDANTPITYTTTYASNTPGKMKYGLVVILESVNL